MADVLHRFSWFQYVRHGIRPLANRAVLSGLISRKLSKQSAGSLFFYTLMVEMVVVRCTRTHTRLPPLLKNTPKQFTRFTVCNPSCFYQVDHCARFCFWFARYSLELSISRFSPKTTLWHPQLYFDTREMLERKKLSLWQWFDLWFLAAPTKAPSHSLSFFY